MDASRQWSSWTVKILCTAALVFAGVAVHATGTPAHPDDPHYTAAGFFDMHVCHWAHIPVFFMGLLSTTHFKDVKSVEIVRPDGKELGDLDMDAFRIDKPTRTTPEKYVFITHFAIPETARNGWYTAHIQMKDGRMYTARDYVIRAILPLAHGLVPTDGADNVRLPVVLRWDPVPGARYYKVFINDLWAGTEIYTSGYLTKPELVVPKGLLKPDGYYSWQVHSRDINGDVLLGDFDIGSLTKTVSFTVAGNANGN